jgi:hypothetical protein
LMGRDSSPAPKPCLPRPSTATGGERRRNSAENCLARLRGRLGRADPRCPDRHQPGMRSKVGTPSGTTWKGWESHM